MNPPPLRAPPGPPPEPKPERSWAIPEPKLGPMLWPKAISSSDPICTLGPDFNVRIRCPHGPPRVGSGWSLMRKTAAPLDHRGPLAFPEENVESPLWPRGALPTLADPIPGGWGWGEKCFPHPPFHGDTRRSFYYKPSMMFLMLRSSLFCKKMYFSLTKSNQAIGFRYADHTLFEAPQGYSVTTKRPFRNVQWGHFS